MSTTNIGMCEFCDQTFSARGMTRHLQACSPRKEQQAVEKKAGRTAQLHHLKVAGKYYPEYWMHLEMAGESSLANLDRFLRAVWLECCGHLSEFRTETTDYRDTEFIEEEDPLFPAFGAYRRKTASMNVPLARVFETDEALDYQYDFGSTTHLRIEVKDLRTGVAPEKGIRIMARNIPPEFSCTVCGKQAAAICVECQWIVDNPFYCDSCAEDPAKHACDAGYDMMLPVVNSPRMGVCGYCGPSSPEPDGWRMV
ncbi:MAG TPA: hypothetical protein VKA68_13120 [bacterium]|nr:hypothetical protein [bacterium]